MIPFYLPDTPIGALSRALHFIALAGIADVTIGRRLADLKARARRAPMHQHGSIAREYTQLVAAFNTSTRAWWRMAELWPVAYRLEQRDGGPAERRADVLKKRPDGL